MSERLSDLIIDNGPYVVGQLMPFPQGPNGHPLITATQFNELRDELIRLRRCQTTVEDCVDRWLGRTGEAYDIRQLTDDLRKAIGDTP